MSGSESHSNRRRVHAGPRRGKARDEVPAPSHAERARTLLHLGKVGTLATQSNRQEGFPFASLMPYALDEEARPLLLISAMAVHTANLCRDPKASLLVTQEHGSGDPLGAGRVTLMGPVTAVPEEEVAAVRETYLKRHPRARYWVDFDDFAFYRQALLEVYFVGGFGVMGWVEADEVAAADPDPLAEAGPGILSHMNEDHGPALEVLARWATGAPATEARMTAVDRLGFHLRYLAEGRQHGLRIPFPRPVDGAGACRQTLVAMVGEARRGVEE